MNNSYVKDRVKTGSMYHVEDVLDNAPAKDDEWFTETHHRQGQHASPCKVDGKQIATWTQPADWNGGREGPGRAITGPGTIAFQAHDPNSTCSTRTCGSSRWTSDARRGFRL